MILYTLTNTKNNQTKEFSSEVDIIELTGLTGRADISDVEGFVSLLVDKLEGESNETDEKA